MWHCVTSCILKWKRGSCLPYLRIFYGLNLNSSPTETKKFVDLLFKTLETQVYDVPATSAAMVVHHTASTDVAPVIAVEPAPAKVLVTKQAAEPILSESQNTANASNAQPVTGNQVNVCLVLRQHFLNGLDKLLLIQLHAQEVLFETPTRRLAFLRLFMILLSPSGQILGMCLKLGHSCFLP